MDGGGIITRFALPVASMAKQRKGAHPPATVRPSRYAGPRWTQICSRGAAGAHVSLEAASSGATCGVLRELREGARGGRGWRRSRPGRPGDGGGPPIADQAHRSSHKLKLRLRLKLEPEPEPECWSRFRARQIARASRKRAGQRGAGLAPVGEADAGEG